MDKNIAFSLIENIEHYTRKLKIAVATDSTKEVCNMTYAITVIVNELNDLIRDFL